MRRIGRIAAISVVVLFVLLNAGMPQGDKKPLPCLLGDVRPVSPLYCVLGRHMVRGEASALLADVAAAMSETHPGSTIFYMDASGRVGGTLWPHRSHGDGRQIDIALFYERPDGRALRRPPGLIGYGAYEPPPDGLAACSNRRPADFGDPSPRRRWQIDAIRTRQLVQVLVDDARVDRIFLEPHLTRRLGFEGHPKVRFAGCRAARHDDHIHIDLH